MRICNFGSLNIDRVFRVEHIARPGETLPAASLATFAGGKGANQSVALAHAGVAGVAGVAVHHAGCLGADGRWLLEKLAAAGVDVGHVRIDDDAPTGQAIIQVDDAGENAIILLAGANHRVTGEQIERTLGAFEVGDWLLLQNEINDVAAVIQAGRAQRLRVALNPAPFTDAVRNYPLDGIDLLIVNETEAAGLAGMQSVAGVLDALAHRAPRADIVLTRGAAGVAYRGRSGATLELPAADRGPVVDTTAAGDTFVGYYLAHVAGGASIEAALARAVQAAAVCVTRPGAMDAIPRADEV
ncbi:MAG: ribokinase [Phycisphaeraceae bacterium]